MNSFLGELGGLVTVIAASRRARGAVDVLADLLETTVDLHGGDLAVRLGLATGPTALRPEVGAAVMAVLRRDRVG